MATLLNILQSTQIGAAGQRLPRRQTIERVLDVLMTICHADTGSVLR